MLRSRLITAAVIAPLIIVAVLKLPPLWFAVVWGAVVALAAWEWAGLAGVRGAGGRIAFLLAVVALQASGKFWAPLAVEWLAWPVVAWWFIVGMAMRMAPERLARVRFRTGMILFTGLLVLVSAWILLVWLRVNFGVMQVLYLILLVWLADAGAYFVGRRFGRTKLLPQISPGKTVEGVYGALFVVGLYALGVGLYYRFEPFMVADFVLLSLLTVVISIAGDLFESLIKRHRGVKDSGTLFPGHGGVLDRVDSLLAAVSVFYLGSYLREFFL